jgi:hypothetical protein
MKHTYIYTYIDDLDAHRHPHTTPTPPITTKNNQVSLGPFLRCPIRYRLGEVGRLLWSWRSLSQSLNAAFVSRHVTIRVDQCVRRGVWCLPSLAFLCVYAPLSQSPQRLPLCVVFFPLIIILYSLSLSVCVCVHAPCACVGGRERGGGPPAIDISYYLLPNTNKGKFYLWHLLLYSNS